MENDTRSTLVGPLDDGVRLACDGLAESWESTNQALRVGGVLDRFVTGFNTEFVVTEPKVLTAWSCRVDGQWCEALN